LQNLIIQVLVLERQKQLGIGLDVIPFDLNLREGMGLVKGSIYAPSPALIASL